METFTGRTITTFNYLSGCHRQTVETGPKPYRDLWLSIARLFTDLKKREAVSKMAGVYFGFTGHFRWRGETADTGEV